MAQKRSWFNLVKRLFSSDTESKREKDRRRKWRLFGKFKVKSSLASIAAPPSPTSERTPLIEAEEEQSKHALSAALATPPPPRSKRTPLVEAEEEHSKHALSVALATAAAAEAAVAAAQAAAEVVLLTGVPHSINKCEKETDHLGIKKVEADAPNSTYQRKREIRELAAIEIQAACRGYLARKALRALKGIVKLQAIIRGQNVRRQAMTYLKCLHSNAAPPSLTSKRTPLVEAEEKQSKHALSVAATAAAEEEAVAAAQAAAKVVLLTGVPHSINKCEKQTDHLGIKVEVDAPHSTHQCEKEFKELAAIKIQAAFRGFLAKKALRAMKGIVKLQAIIRGRNVRRQAMTTLKCLQSIVNIQSQVCAKRIQMVEGAWTCSEHKRCENLSDKIIKIDMNSKRRWDSSLLTKEEADAAFLSKKEAAMKRERIREYWINRRNSAETERDKPSGRWRYWLDQWVDTQVVKSTELEDLNSVLTSNHLEGIDSPISAPRKSFHRRQHSLGEVNSFSSSPVVVPTYMAATESAKAKSRSMSSLKLRPGSFDAYSDSYSPSKNKLSPRSSTATEVPSSARYGRPSAYQQRSPSLKGLPGPVKCIRPTSKDLSFDSDCSLKTWDQQSSLR